MFPEQTPDKINNTETNSTTPSPADNSTGQQSVQPQSVVTADVMEVPLEVTKDQQNPWTEAKRTLMARAFYYMAFDIFVYGFYLFAESHGYWPWFFVLATLTLYLIEFRIKFTKYKNSPSKVNPVPSLKEEAPSGPNSTPFQP